MTSPIPKEGQVARFWAKTEKTDACWNWTAARMRDGYGKWSYSVNGQKVYLRAHRFAWLVTHGTLTEDKELHHRCENRACVRPDHMEEITRAEHRRKPTKRNGRAPILVRAHCDRGHPLTGDNLCAYEARQGIRKCLTCKREANRTYKERHREKIRERKRADRARTRQNRRIGTEAA
jgi:hypothetical protein